MIRDMSVSRPGGFEAVPSERATQETAFERSLPVVSLYDRK